ncbi:MAG: TetR family transcriptional regulator, partial [Pseudomonadota bacterium]|nr:TetR family transcriptional regulator [Pseudomonadota bacterium]
MNRPAATRKFGEKREAIVQAAAVLINEVGVQATTLAEVARAIGLNATSVTYYFPRKEQLVVAVYDQTLTLMENIAREALAQEDPAARLRHFIAAHVTLRQRIRAGEHGLTTALSEIRTLEPEVQDPLMAH